MRSPMLYSSYSGSYADTFPRPNIHPPSPMKTPSDTPAISSLYHTKNRIAAVDISRIMAAFSVMLIHFLTVPHILGSGTTQPVQMASYLVRFSFGHISYMFIVLAGYFACRNLTWKKALNNAWWVLAPFLLWNFVSIIIDYSTGRIPENSTWFSLMGTQAFILPQWSISTDSRYIFESPQNLPLWFMRDLFFLYLLSPLLYKYAKWLFPLFLLTSLIPGISVVYERHIDTIICPSVIATFTAGCFLRSRSQKIQDFFLRFHSVWLIAGYMVLQLSMGYIFGRSSMMPSALWHVLLSVWVFYQIARWIDVHVIYVRKLALKYAPITFLTFATHWFIFKLLPGWNTNLPLLYPFLTFFLCGILFFALKRWARPLLHLVAHYKLRPDDFKHPEEPAQTRSSSTAPTATRLMTSCGRNCKQGDEASA